MTKKNYIVIAKAIKDTLDGYPRSGEGLNSVRREAIKDCALAIAKVLREDNSRFDWWRFMEACGIEDLS